MQAMEKKKHYSRDVGFSKDNVLWMKPKKVTKYGFVGSNAYISG